MLCHPIAGGAKEEATFEPTAAIGPGSGMGSQMMNGVLVRVGVILEGVSS